jgi:REP element-mobilizing transposase RayT
MHPPLSSSPSHYIQRDQFSIQRHARFVVSAFRFAVELNRIYLRAFVVMPDHWHALFALREPWTVPKFLHDVMSFVGRETGRFLNTHDTAWQDGYYDTHVKTAKQFEYVA